jgi:hypothetical protein
LIASLGSVIQMQNASVVQRWVTSGAFQSNF